MLTALIYYTAKPERIDAFKDLVNQVIAARPGEDAGCLSLIVHQRLDNPCEFLAYEQWRDQASLDAFIAQVDRSFSHRGGIDAVIEELVQKTQVVMYDVIA